MKGYVYILSNPSMPGIVKIGRTSRSVHGRAGELYQTGVPTPFVVEHYLATPDCVDLERRMHVLLSEHRVGDDREFFRTEVPHVRQCLTDLLREQIDEIVYEYLPDQIVTDADLLVDPGDIGLVCHHAGVEPSALIASFEFLDADAIHAAIALRAKRRAWVEPEVADAAGGLLN